MSGPKRGRPHDPNALRHGLLIRIAPNIAALVDLARGEQSRQAFIRDAAKEKAIKKLQRDEQG